MRDPSNHAVRRTVSDAEAREAFGELGLIRFGGHLPKGGYDVDHGGQEAEANPAQLH